MILSTFQPVQPFPSSLSLYSLTVHPLEMIPHTHPPLSSPMTDSAFHSAHFSFNSSLRPSRLGIRSYICPSHARSSLVCTHEIAVSTFAISFFVFARCLSDIDLCALLKPCPAECFFLG